LLLFGDLPTREQLNEFEKLLSSYRELPEEFLNDMILNLPGKDIMNVLARSVLAYYTYDSNPDDTSVKNVLRQCMRLIGACLQLPFMLTRQWFITMTERVWLFIPQGPS